MNEASSSVVNMVEAEIRDLVRGSKSQSESPAELCSDVLKAGATSIAEISKLMDELQAARDFLQAEGERVQRMAERYSHLTTTASASVKIISESMGTWRNPYLGLVPQRAEISDQSLSTGDSATAE